MVVVPALSGRLLAGAHIKSNIHAIGLRCHARKTPFIRGSNAAPDISQAWTSPALARGSRPAHALDPEPWLFHSWSRYSNQGWLPDPGGKEEPNPANPYI